MAEDDPELWEALHRLTCVMNQMHDHDMLRTDWSMNLSGYTNKIHDYLKGVKEAPDDHAAGDSTVKVQKEKIASLEKEIQQHEGTLKSHITAMEAEIAQVKAKHEPNIQTEKLAISNCKSSISNAQHAISAANNAYTLELKAQEAQSKADAAKSKP
jgi:chromosome segregation ATPase